MYRLSDWAPRLVAALSLHLATAVAVQADDVSMSFGGATPPYVFAETETGMEVDVIREALALRGHRLRPVFVPAGRIIQMLAAGEVDAASRGQGVLLNEASYYQGDAAVFFFDTIFTLAERNIELVQPADLNGLSIVAFADAARIYPEWLAGPAAGELYREVADQTRQIRMLDAGRADVIVADRYIVRHLSRQLSREEGVALKPTRMFLFTDPWAYLPVFRSERIRDDFNAGLRALRENGRYDQIVASYLK